MFPYLIIISIPLVSLCLEWFKEVENSHKRVIMLFIAICYIFFSGLRWECGNDWEQFYGLFYSFKNLPFTEVFNHKYDWITGSTTLGKIYEPGYALMNWLFVNITGSFNAMLVFYTSIMIVMYYKLSWLYSPKYPIYLFTFFIAGNIFFWRSSFAATICFFAIKYIISRKFLKFLLFCVVAISMHDSAILMLPFYFILNRNISNIYIICTYLFCSFIGNTSILLDTIGAIANILSSFIAEFSLITKLTDYLNVVREVSLVKFVLSLFKYGIFIFIFCMYRKYFITDNRNYENAFKFNTYDLYNVMLNSYVIASCIWMLFRTQMQIFVRFAAYFMDSFAVLNVIILSILPKNKRKIFFAFVVLNVIYIAFGKFANEAHLVNLLPYKTIFDR